MIQFSISADKPVNMSADDAVIIRGGYYLPSVSSEGDLSWSPSKSDMPSVAPVNIKGPPGVTGAQGPQGETGPVGPQGPAGETGLQGEKGDPGETGPQGPRGETGAQGPAGPQGETGPQGATGQQGPRGIQGEVGPQGPQGEIGPAGPQGIQGPEGPRGFSGVAVQTSGYVAFNVTEDGILQCSYTGDEQPNYYINENGHLCFDT